MEPSFVNCHRSVDSFQRITVFVDVPRSISIPAFCEGVPVTSLFKTTMLSATLRVCVFTLVVVPEIVKLPDITKLPAIVADVVPNESVEEVPSPSWQHPYSMDLTLNNLDLL